jgi:hypothetical protein
MAVPLTADSGWHARWPSHDPTSPTGDQARLAFTYIGFRFFWLTTLQRQLCRADHVGVDRLADL